MSISISLHRTPTAYDPYEISNLQALLEDSSRESLDLYKMTEDLAIIFHNDPDPFNDTETFPYIMLFGAINPELPDIPQVGGFIPTVIVEMINQWIDKEQISTWDGFEKMYDNLSPESKTQLEEISSPDKKDLYDGYVAPLVKFYRKANEEKNSIFVCGR